MLGWLRPSRGRRAARWARAGPERGRGAAAASAYREYGRGGAAPAGDAYQPPSARRGIAGQPSTLLSQVLDIRDMHASDWRAVERIYAEGIATGDATFETEPPTWEAFDAG